MEEQKQKTEEGQRPQVGFQVCTPGLSVVYILPLGIKGLPQQHLSHPERERKGQREGGTKTERRKTPKCTLNTSMKRLAVYVHLFLFLNYSVELFRQLFSTTFLL